MSDCLELSIGICSKKHCILKIIWYGEQNTKKKLNLCVKLKLNLTKLISNSNLYYIPFSTQNFPNSLHSLIWKLTKNPTKWTQTIHLLIQVNVPPKCKELQSNFEETKQLSPCLFILKLYMFQLQNSLYYSLLLI